MQLNATNTKLQNWSILYSTLFQDVLAYLLNCGLYILDLFSPL